jgi:excinuclease ABC subunit C
MNAATASAPEMAPLSGTASGDPPPALPAEFPSRPGAEPAPPPAVDGSASVITVFFVRDGKLVGRERHLADAGDAASGADAVAAFISQHYANQSSPPKEIIIEEHIPDEQFVAEALSENAGCRVRIIAPQRGAKRELLRLARNDVDEAVRREERRAKAEAKKRERLSAQLSGIFGDMPEAPRIESYDISHTGGSDSVGAMVVFTDYSPSKRDYRRFRIRGEEKGDDYAAMQETLYRRLKRAAAGDKSFLPLPALLLIDGGKGHVTAARQVLDALRASSAADAGGGPDGAGEADGFALRLGTIRLAGMVKDDKHRTRALIIPGEDGSSYDEIVLKDKSELFHLIGQIQEETHRFAVDYHHKRRDRTMKA